jgi:hypothetical protein
MVCLKTYRLSCGLVGWCKSFPENDGLDYPPAMNPQLAIRYEDTETPSRNLGQTLPNKSDVDPDLARVHDAWPELPEHIRAAISALVATAPAKR